MNEVGNSGRVFDPSLNRPGIAANEDQFEQSSRRAELLTEQLRARDAYSPSPASSTLARSESLSAAFSQQNTVEIALETREGDRVLLRFSANQSAQFESSRASTGGVRFSEQAFSIQRRESLELQIIGDFSNEERQAVENLLADVDDLLNSFFAGDFEDAFLQATTLSFDSSVLSSFGLDASLTRTAEAVQRYREVERIGKYEPDSPGSANSGNAAVGELDLSDLIELLAQRTQEIIEKFEQGESLSFTGENASEALLALLLNIERLDVDRVDTERVDVARPDESSDNAEELEGYREGLEDRVELENDD